MPILSNEKSVSQENRWQSKSTLRTIVLALLLLATGLIYAYSNPSPAGHFDYQLRIAGALLQGKLGITAPPPWLNEMVPSPRVPGEWYSVFPLGSVLCLLPLALLKRVLRPDQFTDTSVRWLVAAMGMGIAYFLFRLSARTHLPLYRRLMLTGFALFGSWLWPNLTYGGAWDLALGFAVLGQAGALYFTLGERPNPLLAGFWFAVGFGNRTEVLLIAPLLPYLLWYQIPKTQKTDRARVLPVLLRFLAFPLILGVLTLAYNRARFGSLTDFGYARIPGILNETWYRAGLISLLAIPMNVHTMLFEAAWRVQDHPPYFLPNPMGGSILGSSPYLFLVFRETLRRSQRVIVTVCWLAVGILTLALWVHGNQGGWQFTYRYGLVLLPWLFLLLLEKLPRRLGPIEVTLLIISVALNAFATYQFFWTNGVHV